MALKKTLSTLTPRQLQERARQLGISEGEIESAQDVDDVKEALITMILLHTMKATPAKPPGKPLQPSGPSGKAPQPSGQPSQAPKLPWKLTPGKPPQILKKVPVMPSQSKATSAGTPSSRTQGAVAKAKNIAGQFQLQRQQPSTTNKTKFPLQPRVTPVQAKAKQPPPPPPLPQQVKQLPQRTGKPQLSGMAKSSMRQTAIKLAIQRGRTAVRHHMQSQQQK